MATWQQLAAGEVEPGETWISGPKLEVFLEGKVSGRVVVQPQGNGYVFVSTDGAHVNDDNPAIDFRGESWLVTLRLKNGADPSPHIIRRQSWSDAPPSYGKAIVLAVIDTVASHLAEHPDAVRGGALASLNNDLYHANEEVRKTEEAAVAARVKRDEIRDAFDRI